MYYQIEQVLEQYGLENAQTYKGRGVLICENGSELLALKEFQGSQEKAEFLYLLGEYLKEQGLQTDGLRKTQEGLCTAEGPDGVCYTMHRWFKGKECDVKNRMDIMMAVSHLAKFHTVVSGFQFHFQKVERRKENVLYEYSRHNKELRKIRNYIKKRKQKSDFERLFLKCFPEFFEQCLKVEEALSLAKEQAGSGQEGICHGDFNQHNIIFGRADTAMIHFEKAKIGIQISDFSNFMRKIMEKYNWEETLGMSMIEEYNRINPISREDFVQLYYRLAYPEKFWKIANHYFGASKAWISGRNLEKLQKEILQHKSRCHYLECLLHRL